jgi:hypothetical protein
MDQVEASATINESEGYVSGVDSVFIRDTFQNYETQVKSYITQNFPEPTTGDVFGTKDIIKHEFSYLLGALPPKAVVLGGSYAEIPDNLRHKITFEVEKDSSDDTPLTLTKNLPELAGKRITLSYAPATGEDEAVIESYLPEPHPDGSPIQPEELPDSLPAYLINVIPELRIDGQLAATGTAVCIGTEETFSMQFCDPSITEAPIINDISAGAFLAIGLNLGKISHDQILELEARVQTTKARLEAEDPDVTKEDFFGDLLYATAVMYHLELGITNVMAARRTGVAVATLPSENIFSARVKVDTFFGVPHSVSHGGLSMDADRLVYVLKALDGDGDKALQYTLNSGITSSALEHGVPQQLWSSPDDPVEAISAVKALRIANEQGIATYTIDQSNVDAVLPQLQIDSLAKTDIQNAINMGKVVTVSKENIDFNGWIGCGYIILDPDTGAGAYMISEGLSGALMILTLISFLFPALLLVTFGWVWGSVGLALLVFNMLSFFGQIKDYANRVEAGTMTAERATALTEIQCYTTIIGNLIPFLKKDSTFRLIAVIFVNIAKQIFDAIQNTFFEDS